MKQSPQRVDAIRRYFDASKAVTRAEAAIQILDGDISSAHDCVTLLERGSEAHDRFVAILQAWSSAKKALAKELESRTVARNEAYEAIKAAKLEELRGEVSKTRKKADRVRVANRRRNQ